MGIHAGLASIILQEHAAKSFGSKVVTIGRQTVILSQQEAMDLATASGVNVRLRHYRKPTVDDETRAAKASSKDYITDKEFFTFMGVRNVEVLDVSKYEGASVVCDLSKPQPQLEGTTDVLIDGSSLDNIFDPATALRNLAGMLKPGGRLISNNVGSNHSCPYVIPTPLWFFDYFVVNKFSRCDVYVVVRSIEGTNVLRIDPLTMTHGKDSSWTPNIESQHTTHIIVIAERGLKSTHDKNPIQHQYRSEKVYKAYMRQLEVVSGNAGPNLIRSTVELFTHVPPGYEYIAPGIEDVQA